LPLAVNTSIMIRIVSRSGWTWHTFLLLNIKIGSIIGAYSNIITD